MNSYIIKKPCFKCNYTKVEFQYKTGVFKIQVIRLKQTTKIVRPLEIETSKVQKSSTVQNSHWARRDMFWQINQCVLATKGYWTGHIYRLNESSAFKYCLSLVRYVVNICNLNGAYNLLDFYINNTFL